MPKFEVGDRIRLVAEKALWSDGTESAAGAVTGSTGTVLENDDIEVGLWVEWDGIATSLKFGWVDPALLVRQFNVGDRVVLVDPQFSWDDKHLTSHLSTGGGASYHEKYVGTSGIIVGLSGSNRVRPQYLLALDNDSAEYSDGNGYFYDAVSFEPWSGTTESLSTLDDLDVPTEEVNEIIERIPTVQEIFTSFTGVNPEEDTKVSVGNPEIVTGFTLKRNDNGGVDLYLNDKLFPYAIEQDGLYIEDRQDGYTIRLQIPVVLR